MVHQIPKIDINNSLVCPASHQKHYACLLERRGKLTNNLRRTPITPLQSTRDQHQKSDFSRKLAMNFDRQQQLPVVELRPFSNQVWRREKSLPDFYDKKRQEELNTPNANNENISSSSSKLIQDLSDLRRTIETRQNTFDSAFGKYRNHPKAEFLHESNREWHKQDLIPSFITRFERTKTSLENLSRENTVHRINLDNTCMFENSLRGQPNPGIKIKGGKMNQKIDRRHLLYLNPLDSYRHQTSISVPHFNSNGNSRQSTGRDKLSTVSRHSFPLTSNRTREILLGDTRAQHPLKPIRREGMESPHKFNSKLGAAKNSLEILSKIGIQTRVEKTLEKEMEWNLERYRKDRLLFTHDFRSVQLQCFNFDSNLTVGELSLRNAQDANKPRKGKMATSKRGHEYFRNFTSYELFNSLDGYDIGTQDPCTINPLLHPINNPLVEETETIAPSESDKSLIEGREKSFSAPVTGPQPNKLDPEKIINPNDAVIRNKSSPSKLDSNGQPIRLAKQHKFLISDDDMGDSKQSLGTDDNNNDTNVTSSVEVVDSSRLETNVEYIKNLQLKSTPEYLSSNTKTPDENLSNTSQNNTVHNLPRNTTHDQQSTHRSDYTSHYEATSQLHSPRSIADAQQKPAPKQNIILIGESSNTILEQTPRNQNSALSSEENISSRNNQVIHSASSGVVFTSAMDSRLASNSPALSASTKDNLDIQFSEDAELKDDSGKQKVVEVQNASPLTSSGFESQPVTDQEDEALVVGEENSKTPKFKDDNLNTNLVTDRESSDSVPFNLETMTSSLHSMNTYSKNTSSTNFENENGSKNGFPNSYHFDKKMDGTMPAVRSNSFLTPREEMQPFVFSEDDEGISMAPSGSKGHNVSKAGSTSNNNHDHSKTDKDNGDSGISTTFLTSEDAKSEILDSVNN